VIPFEEALREVLARVVPLPAVDMELGEAVGTGLAVPLQAHVDSPRFDNSAVDGYGVRLTDVPGSLRCIGAVAAGSELFLPRLELGQAVRILTGAPVPPGVEAVVMQEDCVRDGNTLTVSESVRPGANIRRRGEEYRVGDELLPAGTLVTPAVLGLAAGSGLWSLRVHRRPSVGLVTTGNELAAPGSELGAAEIYESNSAGLGAAMQCLGASVEALSVGDDPVATRAVLKDALDAADLVVTTGGVSVGDHDVVKESLESLGVERVFWRIAMKPGKPVFFGVRDQTLVFGLPGNPVSALVTFHLLVRPAILASMGIGVDSQPQLRALLTEPLAKSAGRAEFVRGRMAYSERGPTITPTKGRGSHMVGGIASADALIHLSTDACDLKAGDWVPVSPLRWSHL
jgi:molybdopterin molybdotransferase